MEKDIALGVYGKSIISYDHLVYLSDRIWPIDMTHATLIYFQHERRFSHTLIPPKPFRFIKPSKNMGMWFREKFEKFPKVFSKSVGVFEKITEKTLEWSRKNLWTVHFRNWICTGRTFINVKSTDVVVLQSTKLTLFEAWLDNNWKPSKRFWKDFPRSSRRQVRIKSGIVLNWIICAIWYDPYDMMMWSI